MAVFVSYSSRDKKAVDNIVRALTKAHEEVWLDEKITGGEQWWRRILKQIRDSDAFVIALSENSEESKPCQAEFDYAVALGLAIIPVLIGPVESMMVNRVGELQIIDYLQPDADSAVALITAVREAREQPREPPASLPDEPPVPFEYLMRLKSRLNGPLGPDEQDQLVAELRKNLRVDRREDAAREGIAELLRKLRQHPHLTVSAEEQIGALLDDIATQPMPRLTRPALSRDDPPQARNGRIRRTADWRPSRRVTITTAAVLAVGVVGGVLVYMLWPRDVQTVPPPGSDTSCPTSNSGTTPFSRWSIGPHTSCPFAENVAGQVTSLLQPRLNNPPTDFVLDNVPSPATGKTYIMTCTLERKLVTCRGGINATVYIY